MASESEFGYASGLGTSRNGVQIEIPEGAYQYRSQGVEQLVRDKRPEIVRAILWRAIPLESSSALANVRTQCSIARQDGTRYGRDGPNDEISLFARPAQPGQPHMPPGNFARRQDLLEASGRAPAHTVRRYQTDAVAHNTTSWQPPIFGNAHSAECDNIAIPKLQHGDPAHATTSKR